jgi:TonB family protein
MHGLRAISLAVSLLLHAVVLVPVVLVSPSRSRVAAPHGPGHVLNLLEVGEVAADNLPSHVPAVSPFATERSTAGRAVSRDEGLTGSHSAPQAALHARVFADAGPVAAARALAAKPPLDAAFSSSLVGFESSAGVEAIAPGQATVSFDSAPSFAHEVSATAQHVSTGTVGLKHAPPPRYPPAARRRGAEGVVLLDVFVGDSGAPRHVAVKLTSGHAELDAAALAAVRRWTFQLPAAATASAVVVPVRFTLQP